MHKSWNHFYQFIVDMQPKIIKHIEDIAKHSRESLEAQLSHSISEVAQATWLHILALGQVVEVVERRVGGANPAEAPPAPWMLGLHGASP